MIIDYINILWNYRHFKKEKCLDVMHCLWKLSKCKLHYELSTGPNLHASYKYRYINLNHFVYNLTKKRIQLTFQRQQRWTKPQKRRCLRKQQQSYRVCSLGFLLYLQKWKWHMVIEITSRYMYIRLTTNLLAFKIKI